MGASYERAGQIIAELSRRGVRATTDPAAANPPVVLLVPPDRTYDVGCGFTARWTLVAVSPTATGADRATWQSLDDMVDAIAAVIPVTDAQLATYALNGKTYPTFLVTAEEAVS